LLRLGLGLPELRGSLAGDHGPLMALGFLGTVISLERAVALQQRWGYAAPLTSGLGTLASLLGWAIPGGWLLVIAGVLLTAIFVRVLLLQPALHTAVMGAGAVAWIGAAALWLAGHGGLPMATWLAGFLVLTVCGERLELSRFTRLETSARVLFLLAAGVFGLGLLITLPDAHVGAPVVGAGLLGLAAWLARYDVARRTVRTQGITRYMAACLLAGYAWLAAAGITWMASGASYGWSYDAKLHTIFLGFVMSMVFGHAPVIVPSVLGVAVPYRRIYWLHVAILHVGLLTRVLGDATASLTLWRAGGILNEVSILLFIIVTAITSTRATRERSRGRRFSRSGGIPRTSV